MNLNPIARLLRDKKKPDLKLFALTPPRKGKRSMVGVENMLGSIAVPEPFSLEIAGDPSGVTVMARCREGSVVKQQLGAHYPQGSIQELAPQEDPLRLSEGEQAWSREIHVKGPEYAPLRPFRSDDLVEEGADPLIALIGSMSELDAGERLVARLDLSSLGPDWSRAHMERAFKRPEAEQRLSADAERARSLQGDGVKMAVLGVGALVAYKGYQWVQDGDMWKTVLLGLGIFGAVMVAGWARWRWNKGRSRIYDPLLIKEKASRIAFAARLEITAILSAHGNRARAERLLDSVAAAYRQYDYAAGASLRAGKVRPVTPYPGLRVPQSGLFRRRNVLGVQEVAALWHPPGAGEDMPLVERSGARVLLPTVRGVGSGALVGESTGGRGRQIHFPDDLLRRHHLYVARTRMGKSTLMQHVVAHKLREKAAGRNDDAIVVIDPHADLVKSILKHVPREVEDRVRVIDLGDESRSVGINLLDSRIFYDRDRTADSVVRVAKGLWEQWGPRMQSILEQTVKSLHEANEELEPDEQYTLLDGLRLLSDSVFRTRVLKKVSDPYLLSWWGRDFKGWRGETRADALAPVQTPPLLLCNLQAGQGHPRTVPVHRRPKKDDPGGRRAPRLHLPGNGGQGCGGPGGGLPSQPGGCRDQGPGEVAGRRSTRGTCRGGRNAVDAGCGLRVDAIGAGQVRGILHTGHAEPGQAGRSLSHHGGHPAGQRGLPCHIPGGGLRRQDPGLGAGPGPGHRGGHHLTAGAPLLRAGNSGNGAATHILHDCKEARGGRPRGGVSNTDGHGRLHGACAETRRQ